MPTRTPLAPSLAAAALLLAAAATLPACGPHVPASYPGPPDVTLGTGYDQFVPVDDGADVPIIMGLQGGYHIWGSVRARYVDPRQVHLVFTLYLAGQDTPLTIRHDHVDLAGTSDGLDFGQHLGSAVFLPDVTMVRDQPCRWRLDVTDLESRTASVERMIHPV
jgi:hypothetical protein